MLILYIVICFKFTLLGTSAAVVTCNYLETLLCKMGNCIPSQIRVKTSVCKMGNWIQKKKFVVKNQTGDNIFFQITKEKLNLDVADIRPGKVVNIESLKINIPYSKS